MNVWKTGVDRIGKCSCGSEVKEHEMWAFFHDNFWISDDHQCPGGLPCDVNGFDYGAAPEVFHGESGCSACDGATR